ncbi:MAG: class IV adenylate cyclase [Sphingobacteriales bacterium]|nr:class IV adenylate cyclase [Sphingobacteriales bacterium]MBI3717753.1 class IV adenylate cyclase [Sphingobacteriales bacterium]
MHLNVEIKARCTNPDRIRNYLKENKADFKGTDLQRDTYFNVPTGRLKLRQGNIENSLIHYERENQSGPKSSHVSLYRVENGDVLRNVLLNALGEKVTVEKQREIYFIDNVKFHLDEVPGLGTFAEIEAIDKDGSIGKERLQEQCEFYLKAFGIKEIDLLTDSYSDMLLNK